MSETSNTTNYGPMEPRLYLAFELGKTDWTLGFTIGLGQAPRRRKIKAGDLIGLERELERAKKRSRARWVLAAPTSGQPRGGEPGGGLSQYRGQPASQTCQDGQVGREEVADNADPL